MILMCVKDNLFYFITFNEYFILGFNASKIFNLFKKGIKKKSTVIMIIRLIIAYL